MSRNPASPASPGAVNMRAWRNSPKGRDYTERDSKRSHCRRVALATLADRHPDEYAAIYEAELKRAGLWPLQQAGRRPE